MAGEIVLGYDESEVSDVALGAAVDLARDLKTKLVVVFGYDPARIGGEVRDLDQALEKRGEEAIRKARGEGEGRGRARRRR